jgi:hypothetical protein
MFLFYFILDVTALIAFINNISAILLQSATNPY